MAAAIEGLQSNGTYRIAKPQPSGPLFERSGLIVSRGSAGLICRVHGALTTLTSLADVIELSETLHRYINENAPPMEFRSIADEVYVPDARSMYAAEQSAAAAGKDFEPTEAERLRFLEMSQNEYSRVMHGERE